MVPSGIILFNSTGVPYVCDILSSNIPHSTYGTSNHLSRHLSLHTHGVSTMDILALPALAFAVTFAIISGCWSVYVVVDMFHGWNKARLHRKQVKGAVFMSDKEIIARLRDR